MIIKIAKNKKTQKHLPDLSQKVHGFYRASL